MTRESHTVINVALKGLHFFRVEIATDPTRCVPQIDALRNRFTEKEGFEVTVTYWRCSGEQVWPKAGKR